MTLNARTYVVAFVFDHTHRCSQKRESGLEGLVPLPLTLQLTRCFSAVAVLLVFTLIINSYATGKLPTSCYGLVVYVVDLLYGKLV